MKIKQTQNCSALSGIYEAGRVILACLTGSALLMSVFYFMQRGADFVIGKTQRDVLGVFPHRDYVPGTVTGVTAGVAAPAVTSAAKNPIRLRKRIRDPLRYNRVVLRNRGYIIAAAAILPGHRPVLSHRPHVTPIMKELADEPVAF